MKTNAYLCEYALAQVGLPYWFGTFGQKGSKKLEAEKRKQYPKMYTAKDFPEQYGQRVHDCAGLIKGALWSDTPTSTPKYNAKEDLGADGLYKSAKKKGDIDIFDKVNGRLVFKGTDKKKTHVGVYVDGYVVEAKGHAYGVKKTKFNAKNWPFWAQCAFFEESIASEPEKPVEDKSEPQKPTPTPTPSPAPAPSKPKDDGIKEYVVISKTGVNVRAERSINAKKLKPALDYGQTVRISKSVYGWYKLADRAGWCAMRFKGHDLFKLKG